MQLLSLKSEKEAKIIKAILKAIQAEHQMEVRRSGRVNGRVIERIGGQGQWEAN